MAVPLAFDLVGDWTSARLMVRMVMLGDSPWDVLAAGFTHRDTGERVTLAMGPPQPALARAIAAGVDPARPTLDERLLEEVTAHRSVVVVADPTGADPQRRAETLLRAAGQIVNGGALAARCRSSGLAHGADGLHALVQRLDEADPDVLVEAYVRFDTDPASARTWGMHALGLPDLAFRVNPGPDRARAALEAEALAWARSAGTTETGTPDDADPEDPRFNPFGRVFR